jgi:hypothetical protein
LGRIVLKAFSLKGLDVFNAVDNTPTQLEELGSLPRPTPPLNGAMGKVQSSSQLDLIEVSYCHAALLRLIAKT